MSKTRKQQHIQEYNSINAKYKKLCQSARKKAWNGHVADTDNIQKMAKLTKSLQQKQNLKVDVLTKEDGSVTAPGKDTLKELLGTHFPSAVISAAVDHGSPRSVGIPTDTIKEKYVDWVSEKLIVQALAKFDTKKSPGPDELKPIIFKHLPPNCIKFLSIIYKAALALHYTPSRWKETKVIFIPKTGKDSYKSPKAFRPISLSNYLLKGLERLCVWRMDEKLKLFPLHAHQHGFTKGKSTESAIANVLELLERQLLQNKPCVGVFLDIRSAFDSISIEHIRRALLKHGADEDLAEWYYDYLRERRMSLELHGQSINATTAMGFPQGGSAPPNSGSLRLTRLFV